LTKNQETQYLCERSVTSFTDSSSAEEDAEIPQNACQMFHGKGRTTRKRRLMKIFNGVNIATER